MALEKFTLATLASMDDGRIREAFEQAVKRCELDCKDRPALEESRKVSMSVTLVPVLGEDAQLDSVNIVIKILDTLPKRCSKSYNMKASRSGLLFNEMSADDVNQATLEFGEPQPTEVPDVG